MNTYQPNDEQITPAEAIGEEAAEWLICLRDPEPDPQDPYHDLSVRNRAFFEWVTRSPEHLRSFLETMELESRVRSMDADTVANIRRLIEMPPATTTLAPVSLREHRAPQVVTASHVAEPSYRVRAVAAALIVALCVGVALYVFSTRPEIYTTHVGDQRGYKLKDGSVILLNTDSQAEVAYSARARDIRLTRGEAFFTVQHDTERPFNVISDGAIVHAIGTEFDVRLRPQSVDVAVVKGTVQVAPATSASDVHSSPQQNATTSTQAAATNQETVILSAGDMAEITSGNVTKLQGSDVGNVVSWRDHRLIFRNARLADVADEFNRYNSVHIQVQGTVAKETRLTGIFDTSGYQAILRFARNTPTLSVAQKGNDWVIESRN
jgi:transmembrane sensor